MNKRIKKKLNKRRWIRRWRDVIEHDERLRAGNIHGALQIRLGEDYKSKVDEIVAKLRTPGFKLFEE